MQEEECDNKDDVNEGISEDRRCLQGATREWVRHICQASGLRMSDSEQEEEKAERPEKEEGAAKDVSHVSGP